MGAAATATADAAILTAAGSRPIDWLACLRALPGEPHERRLPQFQPRAAIAGGECAGVRRRGSWWGRRHPVAHGGSADGTAVARVAAGGRALASARHGAGAAGEPICGRRLGEPEAPGARSTGELAGARQRGATGGSGAQSLN